jgi:hypothetical protein
MSSTFAYYRGFGYEIHGNGLFWQTYIYKMESAITYSLIDIMKNLAKPSNEIIHRYIDQIIDYAVGKTNHDINYRGKSFEVTTQELFSAENLKSV